MRLFSADITTFLKTIKKKIAQENLKKPPSKVAPKSLENSKLALVCCSDEWSGWVSSNSPNNESYTSTSPFFH